MHRTYSLARTNRSRKRENDSVPDYEGLARMSGRRVEDILFSAGQGRRIMICGLPSLHLCVRRLDGRVVDDVITSNLAHLSEIPPVVTKQITVNVSTE